MARLFITDTGCWELSGYRDKDGYSQISEGGRGGKPIRAHRASYEMFVGAIPAGLELDHLCRNRPCVNPEHLEPVTTQENISRGQGLAVANKAKTHCHRGHEFNADNTWTNGKRRQCKTCIKERQRTYRATKGR